LLCYLSSVHANLTARVLLICKSDQIRSIYNNPHNLRAPNDQKMRNHVVPPFAVTGLFGFLLWEFTLHILPLTSNACCTQRNRQILGLPRYYLWCLQKISSSCQKIVAHPNARDSDAQVQISGPATLNG